MKKNPFIAQPWTSNVTNTGAVPTTVPTVEDALNFGCKHTAGCFGATSRGRRFLKLICCSSVIFLVLVWFVFREIKHCREVYRMSRLVSLSEAQRRQSLERQRLGESREARLQAELLRQQSLAREARFMKTSLSFPNRRRSTIQFASK